jgi:hypothetical protein
MLGERYTVKAGDTLWGIAKARLGGPEQWPRIWKYNNRPSVIRETGRGIPDPDEIFAGQTLLLPTLPGPAISYNSNGKMTSGSAAGGAGGTGGSASGGARGTGLLEQLGDAKSPISFKFRLDDLKFPPIPQPGFIVEIRMTGDIILKSTKSYSSLYVTSRKEIELQVTSVANKALDSLLFNDTRMVFDSREKKLTYRSMLVANSMTAIGVQFDSDSLLPKLRFEYRLPKLEGSVSSFKYVALDVKMVIELTPKPDLPGASPRGVPVRVMPRDVNWTKAAGTALIVGAGVIIVGTLVEDFFTGGAGVADDPASFAAASAMFMRGLAAFRGAAAVLPAACTPATVTTRFTMQAL